MTNFPSEKLPKEYNQDVFTRAFEDVYKNLGTIDTEAQKQINEIIEALSNLDTSVENFQQDYKQNLVSQSGPMPVPTGLQIRKIPGVPLVIMWCDPVPVFKYPYVGGFQFFASPEENFTALDECAYVTYTGACTAGAAGDNLVDTSNITTTTLPLLGTKYTGIPFWSDMNLVADAVNITNITKDESGSVTAWDKTTPWQITCPLSGGAVWASGDKYQFSVNRNKNMIGQGPLPFAFKIIPLLNFSDKKWDRYSYYGKARFYSRAVIPKNRREGQLTCASTTAFDDQELTTPTNINAVAYEENYYISVDWDKGHEEGDAFGGYRLYRTTAVTTALLDDDTYLIADGLQNEEYIDHGYDASLYTNGPSAGATYYYWVRVYDTGGYQSDADGPDDAILTVPAAPTFLSGAEEESTGYGNLKNWVVQWKSVGGAMGYNVKYKLQAGDYTPATYVPHTTLYGQDAGDDIQQFTFDGLEAGRTYTFGIQSVNNLTVTALQSAFTEQDYTIKNAAVPLPPF